MVARSACRRRSPKNGLPLGWLALCLALALAPLAYGWTDLELPRYTACAPGHYGPDCSGACSCADHEDCDDGVSGDGRCRSAVDQPWSAWRAADGRACPIAVARSARRPAAACPPRSRPPRRAAAPASRRGATRSRPCPSRTWRGARCASTPPPRAGHGRCRTPASRAACRRRSGPPRCGPSPSTRPSPRPSGWRRRRCG